MDKWTMFYCALLSIYVTMKIQGDLLLHKVKVTLLYQQLASLL